MRSIIAKAIFANRALLLEWYQKNSDSSFFATSSIDCLLCRLVQKVFLVLATMKGRIMKQRLLFFSLPLQKRDKQFASHEILFPEVILRCKLPPSKSTIWETQGQSGPRTMPAYLQLFVRNIFTHIQNFLSFVASVKINTTHSTLELIQRSKYSWDFTLICNEPFWGSLSNHMIDPLANQGFANRENKFVCSFSFVKTAICIVVTLFEGADLLLFVFFCILQRECENRKRSNLNQLGYQRQVSVFRNPS